MRQPRSPNKVVASASGWAVSFRDGGETFDERHLEELGERIEQLLARFAHGAGEHLRADAEALVRAVSELYGEALARLARLVRQVPALEAAALDDPLVAGLLAVHDLHPLSAAQRIERALERVREDLAGASAALEAVDADRGVARVAVIGGDRRAASAVRRAVLDAAPELLDVEVRIQTAVPVTLGRRRGHAREAVRLP